MNVGSLFSGIGGIDLGLERAGMRVVWQCESDTYRRAVLRSHWPNIPCYEDVVRIGEPADGSTANRLRVATDGGRGEAGAELPDDIDLLCGGFPCQDLSVAGRRAGLGGARSSLFFEFARVADLIRPRWLLVENVPGLLSSNGGRDFAVVYATLAELGYGLAWRILDSRYFGVPQRRRRVFIVGHLGADGPEPFLPFLEGGQGDTEPGEAARQEVAGTLGGGSGSRGWCDDLDRSGAFVTGLHHIQSPISSLEETPALGRGCMGVAAPLSHGSSPNSNAAGRRREDDENLVTAFHMLQDPISSEDEAPAWGKGNGSGSASIGIATESDVRRLTPTECCRLQGFFTSDVVGRIYIWSNTSAKRAERAFQPSRQDLAKPAHATVHIDFGLNVLALRKAERRSRFVSDVDTFASYPLLTPVADIAVRVARMRRDLGLATTTGKVGPPSFAADSSCLPTGLASVISFGIATDAAETAAENPQTTGTTTGPSTTSERGTTLRTYGSTLTTLFSSVVSAMQHDIARLARDASDPLSLELELIDDAWLGPPNEKPDSPRYSALGDAVTVPVAEWVGRRILEAGLLA